MVEVRPFRAVRYPIEELGEDLGSAIAPPYDVIDEPLRKKLAEAPHNIVHLTLPRGPERHARAGRLLRRWMERGILVRDDSPAFYVLEEEFDAPSGRGRRRCLLGLLHLEEFAGQEVRPHEEIFRRPMEDRLRLLAATEANLEPIFCLHDDRNGEVGALLEEAEAEAEPLAEAEDYEGGTHRLSRITARRALDALQRKLRRRPALIADGHHRYSAALTYAQSQPARKGARASSGDSWQFILSAFVSLQDPGLVILPTHRLVKGLSAAKLRGLQAKLARSFELEPFEDLEALQCSVERGHPGELGLWVVKERHGWKLRTLELPASDPVARLSVSLLEREVFVHALGLGPQGAQRGVEVDYVRGGPDATLVGAKRKDVQLIGLVRAPTPEEVEAVAEAGLRMPRKSTYFHPKVWSGFALHVFGETARESQAARPRRRLSLRESQR